MYALRAMERFVSRRARQAHAWFRTMYRFGDFTAGQFLAAHQVRTPIRPGTRLVELGRPWSRKQAGSQFGARQKISWRLGTRRTGSRSCKPSPRF